MNEKPNAGESVVQLNEHQLDKECVKLPTDFLKWANRAADLRQDLDELKAQMEVVEADLAKRIRDTPGKFGLEKVTDKACEALILLQPDYQEKLSEFNEAKHQLALAEAVVSALEIKKRTLTLLVDLHGMGYFAAPKLSKQGQETVRDMMYKRVGRRNEA